MTTLAFLRVLLREFSGARHLPRAHRAIANVPIERQVAAMTDGGQASGRTAAGYLFHAAQISRTLRGCRTVLDVGCGTGVQLLEVAELNPDVKFVGVDTSERMLDAGSASVADRRLGNVAFLLADCTDLSGVGSASVDGVISTMTLHHLADLSDVARCFAETSRVVRPGGAIYIEDFGRLKAETSVRYFVGRGAAEPDTFSMLYEASLRSAFLATELRAVARSALPGNVRVFTTVPVPFLVVAKTPGLGLSAAQAQTLAERLQALDEARRQDYRDLALAFRLGGLPDAITGSPVSS